LDLSGTPITDNGLQYICGLKELALRDCTEISNSGLKQLIESSPKLKLLEIKNCDNICEPYIYEIAEATRNSRFNNVSLKF